MCTKESESEKVSERRKAERKMRKREREREEHLLASAYCVFVAQGEIVTT